MNAADLAVARRVLSAWSLDGAAVEPLGAGLINLTLRVTAPDGSTRVLQRVNPVFPAEVNADIARVGRRLAAAGVRVPRLVPTVNGDLWVPAGDGTWRMLEFLAGRSLASLPGPAAARSAGRLLGRFHRALDGLDGGFANPRLGVHDTARHLSRLAAALDAHAAHPRYREVAPLGTAILELAATLPPVPPTPDRVVHGDPKVDNLLFDAAGEATALVDLDTVGPMPLPLELGDAFRSWCNPRGEDRAGGGFSMDLFAAAVEGYADAAGSWISAAERSAVVPATVTIIVELAARFAADALAEAYFGWDPARFPSRSHHNQARAEGQLALARSALAHQRELEARAAAAFAR